MGQYTIPYKCDPPPTCTVIKNKRFAITIQIVTFTIVYVQ